MYDLSQLVTLPAPWQVDLIILIAYGAALWLVLWSPNFWRKESENFVRWPLKGMSAIRVIGSFFGFACSSPHTSIASEQYLLLTFTYLWDLGYALLLVGVLCSAITVFGARKSSICRILQCCWLTLAVTTLTIAFASQGANITQTMDKNKILGRAGDFVSISVVKICLRIYFILGVSTIGILSPLFAYSLIILRRRPTSSSADQAHSIAFFLAIIPLGVYTGFSAPRLWHLEPPSASLFSFGQLLPELFAMWIYLITGFLITRWDYIRLSELKATRINSKKYWEETLMDALAYVRKTNIKGYHPSRPRPWIILRAQKRYNIPSGPHLCNQDMIACLTYLKQLADIVCERLVLEEDKRSSLWNPTETRRVDITETMKVVVEVLLVRFQPITRTAAEMLTREWAPVFSMSAKDVRQVGETRLAAGN